MFLLDQLVAASKNSVSKAKRKPTIRKKSSGLTQREQDHLDALIAMGGRGTTTDIGFRVAGLYYSGLMYLRKLEAKGFVRVVGAVDRDGSNPPYIWEVVDAEKQHS